MNERKDKTRTTIELDGTLQLIYQPQPVMKQIINIQILNNFLDKSSSLKLLGLVSLTQWTDFQKKNQLSVPSIYIVVLG